MELDRRIKLEYVTSPDIPQSLLDGIYQISQTINELPVNICFDEDVVRTDRKGNALEGRCVIRVDEGNLEPSRVIIYQGLETLSSERYLMRFRMDLRNNGPVLEIEDKQKGIKLYLYAAPKKLISEEILENTTRINKGKARQLAERILDYLRIR